MIKGINAGRIRQRFYNQTSNMRLNFPDYETKLYAFERRIAAAEKQGIGLGDYRVHFELQKTATVTLRMMNDLKNALHAELGLKLKWEVLKKFFMVHLNARLLLSRLDKLPASRRSVIGEIMEPSEYESPGSGREIDPREFGLDNLPRRK